MGLADAFRPELLLRPPRFHVSGTLFFPLRKFNRGVNRTCKSSPSTYAAPAATRRSPRPQLRISCAAPSQCCTRLATFAGSIKRLRCAAPRRSPRAAVMRFPSAARRLRELRRGSGKGGESGRTVGGAPTLKPHTHTHTGTQAHAKLSV